jgi:hypothetical protein
MTQPAAPYQQKNWNLAALTVTLGAYRISRGAGASGYGSDVVFKLVQSKADFTEVEGADGTVVVCATNSSLTEFELTVLQANSPTNGFLSTARIAAKAAGVALVLPLLMVDQNGTTMFSALKCWITGPPEQEFKTENGVRTWKLKAMPEINFVGGSLDNVSGLDLDAFYAGESVGCLGVASSCETELDALMARAF